MVDLHCRVYDGSYHDVDSSAAAFDEIAGSPLLSGRRQARRSPPARARHEERSGLPEQYMGDVIGDSNSRRGRTFLGMSQRGNAQVIDSEVPLAMMFGYVTDLRSMTQGRATSSLHFSHYAPVPANVQEEVVAKVRETSAPR